MATGSDGSSGGPLEFIRRLNPKKYIEWLNGYEGVAAEFLAGRGGPRSTRIGAETVRVWARQLAQGSSVLDLGCGSGVPITEILIEDGLAVYGVDASPSLVRAFKQPWLRVPVNCEPVEESPII